MFSLGKRPIPLNEELANKKSKQEILSDYSKTPSTTYKAGMILSPSAQRSSSSSSPSTSPQNKITIKPFKVKPKIGESFEQETWTTLQIAIQAIHKKESTVPSISLQQLYNAVEDLCVHKMGESLYQKLEQELNTHIKSVITDLSKVQANSSSFLELVDDCWSNHCDQMMDIRNIFIYLDRTLVLQSPNLKSIWELGIQIFHKYFTEAHEVLKRTISAILSTIESERKGEVIDHTLCKRVIKMLCALELYNDNFQPKLIISTSGFYANESKELIGTLDVSNYLIHIEKRLNEETERSRLYFEVGTFHHLIRTVEKQVLVQHIEEIISKGFDQLMEESRLDDLSRLYRLFQRVSSLPSIIVALKSYIKRIGTVIVNSNDADKSQIQELLDFRQKQDNIISSCFQSDNDFNQGVKESWENVLNIHSETAELLAKYVDSKLRTGEKGLSDAEFELILDRVMALFRHLRSKDIFEAFYKKDLAKRLILQRSASIDAENSMIAKLKIECGSVYTMKLENMFKDIQISNDLMTSFSESKFRTKITDFNLEVKVLTTNCWPSYPPCSIQIPAYLRAGEESFKQFYSQNHSGRCLSWIPQLGTSLLEVKIFSPKSTITKELHVSAFQAVCLLLFNESKSLKFSEIHDKTQISIPELKLTLQSLACAKVRVLSKNPKGKDVDDNDSFDVDEEKITSNKLFRIKINNIQAKETKEEQVKTHEGVCQDRQYQIDAAIVRIMKTRKTLNHTLLVSQLFAQLKFPVQAQDLKKRIESLIDREYMERDSKNKTVYNYLA
eukprot:c21068_g1_i1.p1 GENE.c21068_g1_i1~~c21068_g1_i1.p1  ORF type:complete len:785 (+),score=250.84 c21068_g1_i1:123-2477(+)